MMSSLITQHTVCSICKKPWQSAHYKLCHECREKYWHRNHPSKPYIPRNRFRQSLRPPKRTWSILPAAPLQPAPGFDYSQNSIESTEEAPPSAKQRKIIDSTTGQEVLEQALRFLHNEYKSRLAASDIFPPQISAAHIRRSVARYEDEMISATKRSICGTCGRTVPLQHIHAINDANPILLPVKHVLDKCAYHNNIWDVCLACHASLIRHTTPKFSALNRVNVTACQDYPSSLADLTPVEECVIAKSHPLGVILKLRPGGVSAPINYHALRGHFIVIPQDPGPLLQILPSPELRLQNLIKVFWLGTNRPGVADLSPFLVIRKTKVLCALQYLVQHNHLYHDVIINQPMIDNWTDQFIPPELRDNIICVNEADHHEREGYTVNLEPGKL